MKLHLGVLMVLVVTAGAPRAEVTLPYEREDWATAETPLDTLVFDALRERGIESANPCSDAVFIRRVYLDVTGKLPPPDKVREFLASDELDKRAELINELLDSEDYADYWALKWCDVLRVKAEFPINLWPNAVQAYHHWIRAAIRANMPYDQFVREQLTSSGSNFRVPQVNFYRAMQGHEPSTIAASVALTFMGTRIQNWPERQRDNMAQFFSRVAFKGTAEWKEEIVYFDPAATEPLNAVFPDGTRVQIPAGQDPREVFADWLISDDNPWFARNIVNRVWYWLMGRGIIHEPDDIRPDNPPSNPELLSYLERELVENGYDLKMIYWYILNSRTYQQSSISRTTDPDAEALFAHYIVRQLDAEVLIDALDWFAEKGENYSSQIPEPFTWIPEYQPTVKLADGSITSPFLEMFGRPSRDTGLVSERNVKPTKDQRLYMLNASDVQSRIEHSPKLRQILMTSRGNLEQGVSDLYITLLSREPTDEELAAALSYGRSSGLKPYKVAVDVAWALINSKEFLFKH
ncbi:MAG: DUF1553 domain-containing protein [Armatimonadetes bacterium]|nr:DUF1553 domain-containing protein [Armatimonadota bacterium]